MVTLVQAVSWQAQKLHVWSKVGLWVHCDESQSGVGVITSFMIAGIGRHRTGSHALLGTDGVNGIGHPTALRMGWMCLLPIRNPSSGPCLNHGRWIEKCMGNGVLFRLMVWAYIVEALAGCFRGGQAHHVCHVCLPLHGFGWHIVFLSMLGGHSVHFNQNRTVFNLVVFMVFKSYEDYRNHPGVNKWVTTSDQVSRWIKMNHVFSFVPQWLVHDVMYKPRDVLGWNRIPPGVAKPAASASRYQESPLRESRAWRYPNTPKPHAAVVWEGVFSIPCISSHYHIFYCCHPVPPLARHISFYLSYVLMVILVIIGFSFEGQHSTPE